MGNRKDMEVKKYMETKKENREMRKRWCTPGLHNFWQADKGLARTNRIYEDQEVNQGVFSRCEAVLSPQLSVLSPQS